MTRNPVKEAVERLGGPTKAAWAVRCSGQTVHNWIRAGRVPQGFYAIRLAEASGVPLQDLVGDPERAAG